VSLAICLGLGTGSGCTLLLDFTLAENPGDAGPDGLLDGADGRDRGQDPIGPDQDAPVPDGDAGPPDGDGGPDVPDRPLDAADGDGPPPDVPDGADLPDGADQVDVPIDAPDCTIGVDFRDPTPLLVTSGASINTNSDERSPSVSSDGTVYFARSGIFYSATSKIDGTYNSPVVVNLPAEAGAIDKDPEISADGLTIYFASNGRAGGIDFDIFRGDRATTADPFVLTAVRTNLGDDTGPAVDATGTVFLIDRGGDISRTGVDFGGSLTSLPQANTSSFESGPAVKGNLVYFTSDRFQADVSMNRVRIYVARLDCPSTPAVRVTFSNEVPDDDHADPFIDDTGTLFLSVRKLVSFDLHRASPP
jgi:hypothetical protein